MEEKKVFIKAKETQNGVAARFRIGEEYVTEQIKFRNYVYVKESELIEDIAAWNYCKANSYSGTIVKTENGSFVKLFMKNNWWRNRFRKDLESKFGIHVYEGDINAVKHWLVCNQNMKLNAEDLRITYFDIETDDRGSFLKEQDGTVIAQGPVMSCAIRNHDKPTEFVINEDVDNLECEKSFLKKLFDKLKNTDLLTAWNGKKFDYPYLQQRQEKHSLQDNFDWHLSNRFDDMIKIKKIRDDEFTSFSLNNVSKVVLGDEKVDFSEEVDAGEGRFYSLWKTNKPLLEEYNIKDVDLMYQIEEVYKDTLINFKCSDLCHCPIEDTMFNSMMSDYLMLNKYHDRGIIAPSKPSEAELARRDAKGGISGGYTFCFSPGVWDDLEVYDYKSHYPLIIMTFNICTSTYVSTEEVDWLELSNYMTWTDINYMLAAHKSSDASIKNQKFSERDWKKLMKEYVSVNNLSDEYLDFDNKLEELMWIFIDKYVGHKYSKYAKEKDLIYSPADFNLDTRGWHFHFHRFFKRKQGIVPEIQDFVLTERDVVKTAMNKKLKEDFNFKTTAEFRSMNSNQWAIKNVGNALFGFLAFLKSRFYKYDVADTITTSGRWVIKKSILFARKKGYLVTSGDTDSIFLKNKNFDGTHYDMNKLFYDYYKEIFAPFNCNLTKEVKVPQTQQEIDNKEPIKTEVLPFWIVFEHEHTYKNIIIVAKKRYYFAETGTDKNGKEVILINTQGGAFKKKDTNPLGAKLQKELCEDILTSNYDRQKWIDILVVLKEECFNYELDTKYLTYNKNYSNHYSTYGKPMLDSNTGKQKIGSDGKGRCAPIPAHIRMVERLDKEGNLEYDVGDALQYIIAKPSVVGFACNSRKKVDREKFKHVIAKYEIENGSSDVEVLRKYLEKHNVIFRDELDSKQEAITVEEYKAGKEYSIDAYWPRIIGPVVELLNVADKDAIFKEYISCWNYNEKQIERINKQLLEK